MDTQVSQNPFLTIPQRKLDDSLDDILKSCSDKNKVLTKEGALLTEAFQRYYSANIPVDYWWRDMHNFVGSPMLKNFYNSIVSDISSAFKNGKSAMLVGAHGRGKTYIVCCLLKRALETNKYSALYVNLTDIIHIMLSTPPDVKSKAREMLLNVDFLVIDELDSRFMGSDNAADLFARILEPIMRTRIQNRMPTFFCTNTTNIENEFSGPLQVSMKSLQNLVQIVPIIGGKDAREAIKKGEL